MNHNDQSRGATWATGTPRALPGIVRAHLVDDTEQKSIQFEVMHQFGQFGKDSYWPPIWLTFHTVTTPDEFANLRFGTYIVGFLNPLTHEIGCIDSGFFTGEDLSQAEQVLIEGYCKEHNLSCMPRRVWVEEILFAIGYRGRGVIVGFDLPRQLSHIATRASAIRLRKLQLNKDGIFTLPNWLNKLFAGGWKLTINEYEKKDEPGQWRERGYRPSVWIKPISPTSAMYRWGFFVNSQEYPGIVKWPYRQTKEMNGGNGTNQKDQTQQEAGEGFYAGHFLDLRTLGLALLKDDDRNGRKNRTLRSLGELFGARVLEPESSQHDGPLSESDLDRAMNTTEATLSLYYAELDEYRKHSLTVTPDHIYSGASLGKAYLKSMGIAAPPMLDTREVPYSQDQVLGFAMSAYYPGRSEAHLVNVSLPVTYVDYHGMYPAICIRQGLFDLMKAPSIHITDTTAETIKYLEKVQREDSFNPETWRQLNVLCLVEPQDDMFPIRADFRWRKPQGTSISYRAGLAMIISAKQPMWWPLADCLESKRRTGKPPRILLALKFSPEGSRPLAPMAIRGGPIIDPNQEDFFQTLVEARDRLGKNDPKLAAALKIVANSTSYGIWAEVDIEEGERVVTALSTEQRHAIIPHGEKGGRYYAPIFAALITAGARLMLGLLEGEIQRLGGVTAFCDTDSLAIVSSEKGREVHYVDHRGKAQELKPLTWNQVDEILQKFDSLNPYRSGKPLIKLEPENFEDKDPDKPRVNLYVYVIAAKRYALYVPAQEPGALPKIVKASYHTLGIVEPPRDAQGQEIEDWIDDFWIHIATGLQFNPPWAGQYVEFQLAINRPEIRRSFRNIRAVNPFKTGNKYMDTYLAGVKPFSTLAVLAKSRRNSFMVENVDESADLKNVPVIAPVVMPGQNHSRCWVAKNSGQSIFLLSPDKTMDVNERQAIREAVERECLLFCTPMTFAELLADYLGHHESKALDLYGAKTGRDTRGQLDFPRIRITELLFTGKETILREELECGLVSQEEVEADRVMIRTESDPIADLVIKVLRLLPKAELKRLNISRRSADRIKDNDNPSLGYVLDRTNLVDNIAKYLQNYHSDDVGGVAGEEALHAFETHRNRVSERWLAIKPGLSKIPTKELMKIAGCSCGTAKNIKYGRTQPPIETIKKIVAAYSSGYNSIGA